MDNFKQSLDRYLTREPEDISAWYEQVMDKIPEEELSQLEYERDENFFIGIVDKLFDLCPYADPKVTAMFVLECYKQYRDARIEDSRA